jgi:Cupin-like domain
VNTTARAQGPTLKSPPKLPVRECGIDEVAAMLRAGVIARFDARCAENERYLNWSLDDWEREQGQVEVHSHQLLPSIEEKLRAVAAALPREELVTYAHVKDALSATHLVGPAATTLSVVLREMRAHQRMMGEVTFASEGVSRTLLLHFFDRLRAYAVVNARALHGFSFTFPASHRAWKEAFCFVWFGLSAGSMHFDEMDNTLIQVRGTKRVFLFDSRFTDEVDGGHYVTKFDAQNPLSRASREARPSLATIPYHVVDLEPGQGLVIPARAYHAAAATSHDSISVSSFLLPHLIRGPFPPGGRAISLRDWAEMLASRRLFDVTGRKLCRRGPYEYY